MCNNFASKGISDVTGLEYMLSDRKSPPNQAELDPPSIFSASRGVIILWLIAIGLIFLFVPLFLINTSINKETVKLETKYLTITQSLTLVPTPNPTVKSLVGQLEQVQQASAGIRSVYPTLAAGYTDWKGVMGAISNYNADDLALVSVAQQNRRITLNGRAVSDEIVVAYARALEESGQFASVVVQSLKVVATPFSPEISPTPTQTPIPAAPTITPTAATTPTPVATVPTITPTPDMRDQFEADDTQAATIFLGEPQTHSFYPIYDVDMVKFLAKANRYYRVYTTDLSPGVDTYISVNVEGQTYTNDDSSSGTLNSLVEFQINNGYDSEAVVRITNRGIYGEDKKYDVIAEEIIATQTPTSVAQTKTPKPTSTPAPTSTATPTATPDRRDAYEPDDVNPKAIAVGETQEHNFFPDGDIDRLSFYAKSGRNYQILTSDLSLGVDTFLQVNLNNQVWTNDDYKPAGTGDYSSGICLYSPVNKTAVLTVNNVESQYGPDMSYFISVNEAPILEVNPSTLAFGPVTQGGADPSSKKIKIQNTNSAMLHWTAETDKEWLHISPTSGNTPGELTVSIDIGGMASGNYHATIVISGTDLCTANNPQTVAVDLDISPLASNGKGRAAGVALMAPGVLIQPDLEPNLAAIPENLLPDGKAVEFIIVVELKAASL